MTNQQQHHSENQDRFITEREAQELARRIIDLEKQVRRTAASPSQLRHAAIDGGGRIPIKDTEGRTTAILGGHEPGSAPIRHVGGPIPEQPEPVFVDLGPRMVKIQHSGFDIYNDLAPGDFRYGRIYASQDPDFAPTPDTFATYMDAPDGSVVHTLPPGEWYIGIVWETQSGKRSKMSEPVMVEVEPPVDTDEIDQAIEEAKTELEQAIDERGNRYGTEPPTEAAHDGVIYYQRDTEEGPVVAVWQYRDNQWHGLPLTDAVLTSVTTDKLVAGESLIDGVLIKDGAVTLEKMTVTEEMTAAIAQFLTVRADMLEANAVTADKIGTDAIQARHIAAKAIESDMIEAGAIRTEHVDAKSFVLSDSDSYTRTSISAEGMEVIESWQGYPDPTLQDPDLLAARYTVVDDWHNYELTDAKGTTLFPDTRRFSVRFRITVHSMEGLEVRGLTREVPEAGIAYWTNSWDDIIDSPGDYFLGVGASDVYPYFGWVALKGDVTLHEMWFEPRENVNDLPILSVTKDGLKAWDSSGSETASIGSGGQNFLAGRLFTNSPGQPGVLLNEDYGPSSHQGAGVWLTDDGTAGSDQAAIWATKHVPSGKYTQLNVRAPQNGELTLRGGNIIRSTHQHQFDQSVDVADWLQVSGKSYFHDTVDVDAQFNVGAPGTAGAKHMYCYGYLRYPGYATTSSAANMYLQSNSSYASVMRVQSVRRLKVNSESVEESLADRLLDLEPKTWLDRGDVESLLEEKGHEPAQWIEDTPNGPTIDEEALSTLLRDKMIDRTPGLIAEDLVKAGLDDFAVYDQDKDTGEKTLSSVAYDRLWTLLIPLVRDQRDRIKTLEQHTADLEQRLARLEAK